VEVGFKYPIGDIPAAAVVVVIVDVILVFPLVSLSAELLLG